MLMFKHIADVVSNDKNFSKKFRKKFLPLIGVLAQKFISVNNESASDEDYINFLAMTQNVIEDCGHDVPAKFTDRFWCSVRIQQNVDEHLIYEGLRDWFVHGFIWCIHEGVPIVDVHENAKKKTESCYIKWRDTEAVVEFMTRTVPHYQDIGYKIIFHGSYTDSFRAHIIHRTMCIIIN